MRLLFVTGDLGHGGAERQTITLANRLAERGHDCELAYVKPAASQRQRLSFPPVALDAQRYLDLAALRTLSSLIDKTKPTHVVAANELPAGVTYDHDAYFLAAFVRLQECRTAKKVRHDAPAAPLASSLK